MEDDSPRCAGPAEVASEVTRDLGPLVEEPPVAVVSAARAMVACMVRMVLLLLRRRVHQPRDRLGRQVRFANGSTSAIYRETTVDGSPPTAPAALVVCFRLRWVHSDLGHALFRLESILNTAFFVGFPGFVSKLWLRHDEEGLYRGVYQWDGPALAVAYVRALWWVLALVSVPGSIHYKVLPGVSRDGLLTDPVDEDGFAPSGPDRWWRPVRTET
jgi:hypothetical protein